jgi:carbon storage regulator
MLIVQRRIGQRIVIGGGIEVVVIESGRGGVRLGVIAPRGVSVLRGEVHDAVVAANRAAAAVDDDEGPADPAAIEALLAGLAAQPRTEAPREKHGREAPRREVERKLADSVERKLADSVERKLADSVERKLADSVERKLADSVERDEPKKTPAHEVVGGVSR